eukprot:740275-Pleurochrysis_carterae.AAC.1
MAMVTVDVCACTAARLIVRVAGTLASGLFRAAWSTRASSFRRRCGGSLWRCVVAIGRQGALAVPVGGGAVAH